MLSFTGIEHKGYFVTKPCRFSIRPVPIAKRRGCSQTIAFAFPTSSVLHGSHHTPYIPHITTGADNHISILVAFS